MSEPERPSEETKTELIPQEAARPTLEIAEAARTASMPPAPAPPAAPAGSAPLAAAPPPPPAAAPPADPRPAPLPERPASAEPSYPTAGSYEQTPYPEPTTPPTAAFVPPELLARRRAAAPPSTPYQPIAGWSMAPAPTNPAQADPSGPATGAIPTAGQPQTGAGVQGSTAGAVPAGPANGFATAPGASGHPGPASGTPAPRAPRAAAPGAGVPVWRSAPALIAVATVVIIGLVIGGIMWKNRGSEHKPPAAASPSAPAKPVVLKFSVSSYSPKNNGFREKGSIWKTETYRSATFGNLKEGVGLVFDLGSPQQITSVNFNATTGPLTVELRSADQMPVDQNPVDQSIGSAVGGSVQATGETKLDASKGGKHQYWMIWVTNLGPPKQAVIGGLSVSASSSAS